ncbi:transposase [Modestobacter italicus]|uniref:Transposase n=1 Tax=Modestobacter italicus (strain DSM 44449 / CECT 9708 / BC 501) TaxID=2732864 RepID=I4F0V6_MODI5|nr:transposase [Modestobacter marinus]CCH89269.1 transposase [Modestobacter marinus]
MPKKFPPEFERDMVRVARRGGVTHAEVAHNSDISVESVRRWARQVDVDDGVIKGQTSTEQSEPVQFAPPDAQVGDGERDPAPRGGLLRPELTPQMSYPLVRDLAAEGIPVRLTCGVLGHSPPAYYAWTAAPITRRDLADAYLANALGDAHGDDPEFGYRFLADELKHADHLAGERRIWRLCSE